MREVNDIAAYSSPSGHGMNWRRGASRVQHQQHRESQIGRARPIARQNAAPERRIS